MVTVSPSPTAPAASRKTVQKLQRDEYGALPLSKILTSEQQIQVRKLLTIASDRRVINRVPVEYISSTDTEYECVNNSIYDVLLVRGKVRGLVVQSRHVWGSKRKKRTEILKSYRLVTVKYSKATVTILDNTTCMKRAKNASKLGQLIAHYSGGAQVKCA